VYLSFSLHLYVDGIIDHVGPRNIGMGGGVKLTITGIGFAESQFNFGAESHVGNKVWLVNEYEQKECEVFVEESTPERVICFTP